MLYDTGGGNGPGPGPGPNSVTESGHNSAFFSLLVPVMGRLEA
jgi:hypothetical protein